MLPGQLTNSEKKPVINKKVKHFFVMLFLLFSLWFIVYTLLLQPKRIIDRPLTNFLTVAVTKTINLFSSEAITWVEETTRPSASLIKNGQAVFGVYDVCNGIDLMFIYLGVLFLLPYPLKRKIIYGISGVIAIVLFNIIRICSLYFIYMYHRPAFDFSHHYLFTLLMYVLIFYGWWHFVKKSRGYDQIKTA